MAAAIAMLASAFLSLPPFASAQTADPDFPAMVRTDDLIPAGVCGKVRDVVAMTVLQAEDIASDTDLSGGNCERACRELGETCKALTNLALNCENLYLSKAREVDAAFCRDAANPRACRRNVARMASSSRNAKAEKQDARLACEQAVIDHCNCGG
jgi:hypothetical protein